MPNLDEFVSERSPTWVELDQLLNRAGSRPSRLGDVEQVYHFDSLLKMQMDAAGGKFIFMPWTYPPQFDLLVAPLALIPVGGAYFLFTAATLGLYLLTLRAVAKSYFALVVILLSPALLINLMCGQNGFLTGGRVHIP